MFAKPYWYSLPVGKRFMQRQPGSFKNSDLKKFKRKEVRESCVKSSAFLTKIFLTP